MKAIGIEKYLPTDDPQCFVGFDLPRPKPAGRDLLVRVKAVSVNPVDVKVRAATEQPQTPPRILGWDAAGVVEEAGEGTSLFRAGDEVYYAGAINRPGCDSEFHLVDERIVGRKPRTLSFEEAAAMPLTTITAWEALFERLRVARGGDSASGRSVLIIGGAGGVGSIATQLAKHLAGLRVIATASRDESAQWCRHMGADEVIDHRRPFSEEFKRLGLSEVDYILCFNSTEAHMQNMADVIQPQGRICTIVDAKGGLPLKMSLFKNKSVGFLWEFMFTRPLYQTADMQAQHDLLNEAARLFDNGVLRTTLTERLGPLTTDSLRQAHAKLETGCMIGKLVLRGIE